MTPHNRHVSRRFDCPLGMCSMGFISPVHSEPDTTEGKAMTTNTTKTKTTGKRGVSVLYSHTFSDGRELVRVKYQDERGKADGYYVTRDRDSLVVQWSHATDIARSYEVVCTMGGQVVACDCDHSKFRPNAEPCRHRNATVAMLSAGFLDNGPEWGDEPEAWNVDEERAEIEADYERAIGSGARVCQYRAD